MACLAARNDGRSFLTMLKLDGALYCSDALVLLERVPSDSGTLVYLDPPWGPYRVNLGILREKSDADIANLAYDLEYLSKVIQQSWRILSEHGNLLFHAEPQFSGLIRPLLDDTFGMMNFRAEIIWPRSDSKGSMTAGRQHDTIFWYGKTNRNIQNETYLTDKRVLAGRIMKDARGEYVLNDTTTPLFRSSLHFEWRGFRPAPGRTWRYSKERMDELFNEGRIQLPSKGVMPRYKRYLDESPGIPVGSVWDDIHPLIRGKRGCPALPGEKPLALLDRIVTMASRPKDLVIDPFCGSGVALEAADTGGRRWLGCDLSRDAINVCERRLGELRGDDLHHVNQDELISTSQIVSNTYRYHFTGFPGLLRGQSARFIYNRRVPIEENRGIEFKEVSSQRPADTIKNTADEYVVAYLNSGGNGRILWGVRDIDGVVVGVKLPPAQRDDIRRIVSEKLARIQPALPPTAFQLELHPVLNGPDPDLHVVEIRLPQAASTLLYFTEGNQTFVKTEGGKKELKGLQLQAEILKRLNR